MRTFSIALTALAIAGCGAGQPGEAGWQAAAEQLGARLDEARADRGKVPLLSNAADAPLLHAVFDLDGIWAMDGKEFPEIRARCEPVRGIGRRYSTLGTETGPDGWSIKPDESALRGNWVRYHDELSLAGAAFLLCIARENQATDRAAAARPALQRTPAWRNAAIDGRERTTRQLMLQIGMQSEARGYTSDANRRLLLDTLARAAPVIVDSIAIEQRARVLAAINREMPGLSAQDRATLAEAQRAFESTRCTGACAL